MTKRNKGKFCVYTSHELKENKTKFKETNKKTKPFIKKIFFLLRTENHKALAFSTAANIVPHQLFAPTLS